MKKASPFFVKKKKKTPLKAITYISSAIVTAATVATVVYKYVKKKKQNEVIEKVELDDFGEIHAIMIDSTGDGEIDTIVLNSEKNENLDVSEDKSIAEKDQ